MNDVVHMAKGGTEGRPPRWEMKGYALCSGWKARAEHNWKDVTCKNCLKIGVANMKKHLKEVWGDNVTLLFPPGKTNE